ncbi:uncharacterized protein LOC108090866 [Drosophila ficusphila]|uniref:uncharacterized protein LOC108090866 n=1 Tax=Drosophila ficusphila TaxID=30025 RepID=UPI0007E8A41D|nr:uncharacterized protein LOC108090866 [Drosophila ficusphila]XP_017045246.1 uncharacterized protein LOC108090866 [Drosophila ficusphila]
MCQSCDQSPEWCAKFYSIWCIVWGAIGLVVGFVFMFGSLAGEVFYYFGCCNGIFSILYLLAGIFMLVGAKMSGKGLFLAGKILSYFWPIVNCLVVFPIVVHIMAIIKICKHPKGSF